MEFTLIYERRRSVSIKVTDGEVIVKAPVGTDEEYIKEIVIKHRRWINNRLIASEKPVREEELPKVEVLRLKKEAGLYFTELIEKYSKIMGLNYGRVKITSGKSRLGSCSRDGNICFSYRLMLYPEDVREYVVVHELAHIVEMNHSPAFYRLIEMYMPDYKERKKLLREKTPK